MKHMLLNKFLRNDKNIEAPSNWPDNIKKIEQEAVELKKISQDVTKRLLLCPIFIGCCHNNSLVGSTGNVWNQNWSKTPIDSDKISKKLPEQNLAQSFLLSADRLSVLNPHVSKIFSMLGETNNKLAIERLNWAANVENNVLEKLRICYEELVPSLVKSRRHLWKQNSDLKVLQDRLKSLESNANVLSPNSPILPHNSHLQNPSVQSISPMFSEPSISTSVLNSSLNCVSNSNTQNGQLSSSHENSKLNQLKVTRDELESQIDHLKDLSLREHYRFESSVIDISKAFLNLLRNEANYHQQCLRTIGQVLPDLESSIANNPIPVFGRELSQHLLTSRRHIAYTLEVCVRHLDNPEILCEENPKLDPLQFKLLLMAVKLIVDVYREAMLENSVTWIKGLFRIAGGKNKVDTLSSAFNVFKVEKIIKQYDHFVIADCLKQYLRSLPEPLLTHHLFDDWMRAVNNPNEESRLSAMKVCLSKLPVAYFNNLSYLIGFLAKVSTYSDKNKMTPANLGIVFGPNLLSADSSSSGLYNNCISSTNTVRKKLRSVSNANQMMKKQSSNIIDSTKNCNSVDSNGLLSIDDSIRNGKLNYRYEEDCMSKSMMASNNHCFVIELLISNFNYFFPNQTTQFSSNIPPKVFPNNFRTKRQNSFNGHSSNDCAHIKHKINLPSSSAKNIPSTDNNTESYVNNSQQQSSLSTQHPRRVSMDSSTPTEMSTSVTKSLATTPTGKKSTDFRNGTVFPSCLYRRRVSDGTLSNLKNCNNDNFIGSLDISDLPDIDSSCIDDCQSSSAKSSNDCEDFMDTRSVLTSVLDTDSLEPPTNSQSAKYVPKSFHADVYDTLFALQSLNSYAASADDYLNRVRSVYERRILSKPSDKAQTPLVRRQTINTSVNEACQKYSSRPNNYYDNTNSLYYLYTLELQYSSPPILTYSNNHCFSHPKDPMSKSVTNDSSIKYIDDQNLTSKTSIIRRPKPTINIKLKNYRESSPANIQTLSSDSIDQIDNTRAHYKPVKCETKPFNKLSLETDDSRTAISSVIRYSMPILPAKGINN